MTEGMKDLLPKAMLALGPILMFTGIYNLFIYASFDEPRHRAILSAFALIFGIYLFWHGVRLI